MGGGNWGYKEGGIGCHLNQDLRKIGEDPSYGGRFVKFWPLAALGLGLTSSSPPTYGFIFALDLFPLILFLSLKMKPEP